MVASAMSALALQLARACSPEDLTDAVGRVCQAMPRVLGVTGAVMTVLEPLGSAGSPARLVVGSDATATHLGRLQDRAGEGPLPVAVRSGRRLVTPDLTRCRPPALAAAAVDAGWSSSVTVPVPGPAGALGGVQLFGVAEAPVDARHLADLRPLVEVLAVRLADLRYRRELHREVARSTTGTVRSSPVRRATGVLAERRGIDVEDAATALRELARRDGVPLAEAAAEVLRAPNAPPSLALPHPRPEPGGRNSASALRPAAGARHRLAGGA